jgi:hypothetical protein
MPIIPVETPTITENDLYDLFAIPEEVAKEYGCSVIRPALNELFIDIDSDTAFALMENRVYWFLQNMHGAIHIEKEDTPSKSGPPNRHVVLRLFKHRGGPYALGEWERICLQFYFASDPKREALNTMRLFYGEGADGASENCFFEPTK